MAFTPGIRLTEEQRHAVFQEALKKSTRAVKAYGTHLKCQGYSIEIPALDVAPTVRERGKYRDKGDLFAWMGQRTSDLYYAVKGIRFHFTCLEDFPFTYSTGLIIVCSEVDFLTFQKKRFPEAVIIVNQLLTHAAIIKKETSDQWVVDPKPRYCKKYDTWEKEVRCRVGLCEWIKLGKEEEATEEVIKEDLSPFPQWQPLPPDDQGSLF
jgi:hypothetical protein